MFVVCSNPLNKGRVLLFSYR